MISSHHNPSPVHLPHPHKRRVMELGARAYYLRSILHDYQTPNAREILQNIIKAMKPGYSKFLIFEWVLPDMGSLLYPALLDVNMWALFSGWRERRRRYVLMLYPARMWDGENEG
jgi:hypothetical protein